MVSTMVAIPPAVTANAVDAELPEHGGDLADPGDRRAAAELELPAGGGT